MRLFQRRLPVCFGLSTKVTRTGGHVDLSHKTKDQMKYKLHPLCALFPKIAKEQFQNLVDDIKANGLVTPIMLHEGQILDGQNRYAACLEAGVDPRFEELVDADPMAFVISANLQRRHLTTSQRGIIAGKLAAAGMKVSDAAKALNVSDRSVAKGKKVVEHSKNDAEKVTNGSITLNQAVKKTSSKTAMLQSTPSPTNSNNGSTTSKNQVDAEIGTLKEFGFSDGAIKELSTFMDSAASTYVSRNNHLDIPELKTALVKLMRKYHDATGPKEPLPDSNPAAPVESVPVITDAAILESIAVVKEYVKWWRVEVKDGRKVTFEMVEEWVIYLLNSLPAVPTPEAPQVPRDGLLERLKLEAREAPEEVAIYLHDFIAREEAGQ